MIKEFLQFSGSHRQHQEGQCTDQQTLSNLRLTEAMKLNCTDQQETASGRGSPKLDFQRGFFQQGHQGIQWHCFA